MPTGGQQSKKKEVVVKKFSQGHLKSRLNIEVRIILSLKTSDRVTPQPEDLEGPPFHSEQSSENGPQGPTRLAQSFSDLIDFHAHWNWPGLRVMLMQAIPFARNILLPDFLMADSLSSLQTVFNSH